MFKIEKKEKLTMKRSDSPTVPNGVSLQKNKERLRDSRENEVPTSSRRSSWPAAPKSILKKVTNKTKSIDSDSKEENSIEVESGIGSFELRPLEATGSDHPPRGGTGNNNNNNNNIVENEPGSGGTVASGATVVSARTARKRRIAGIFQHYYPEGGWGYVILFCAFLSHALAHGLQFGLTVLIPYAVRRFNANPGQAGKTETFFHF